MSSTCRLTLNYNQFGIQPIQTIKQTLGQNIQILSYKVNSLINWDQTVLVDVEYTSVPLDSFQIHYIKLSDIKHLIPNSEKYVCEVNGCRVKLNNPKLNKFKDYLPIRIKNTDLNTTDAYDNLYSTNYENVEDGEVFTLKSQTSNQLPIQYFGTTPPQPMNAFCTPMSLLTQELGDNYNDSITEKKDTSVGFNLPMPQKLYPSTFKPKYVSIEETLKQYRQCLINAKLLEQVDDIKDLTSQQNIDKSIFDPHSTTTAYLLSVHQLPDRPISGVILFQPKRVPDVLLFYPTVSYSISTPEIESLRRFVEFDTINYTNFQYLRS